MSETFEDFITRVTAVQQGGWLLVSFVAQQRNTKLQFRVSGAAVFFIFVVVVVHIIL